MKIYYFNEYFYPKNICQIINGKPYGNEYRVDCFPPTPIAKSRNPARIRFPAVPHTIHRADKRLLGVQRFQLTAQVFDVVVDGAVSHHAVIIVQVVQQLFFGKYSSWAHERWFSAGGIRQASGPAAIAPACLETAFVDNQRLCASSTRSSRWWFAAAQNGFHPGDHFTRAVGFTDVIVRADFEAQQAVNPSILAVTMTIGTSEKRRISWHRVRPSVPGSIRSSRIRSGGVWRTYANTWVAVAYQ